MVTGALALCMSISRLASVASMNTIPMLYTDHDFPFACLIGLGVCIYSFVCTIGLASIDIYAEKLFPEGRKEQKSSQGFKFMDIINFKLLFWLLVFSSTLSLMTVFTYFVVVPTILQSKFEFDVTDAGFYTGIPYIITAICLPVFVLMVDFTGKRGHFISLAAVILAGGVLNSTLSSPSF